MLLGWILKSIFHASKKSRVNSAAFRSLIVAWVSKIQVSIITTFLNCQIFAIKICNEKILGVVKMPFARLSCL